MTKPGTPWADDRRVRHSAYAKQDIFRKRLPTGDHDMIAKERVLSQYYLCKGHCPTMDFRAAKINTIGEECLRADLNKFGDNINDRTSTEIASGHRDADCSKNSCSNIGSEDIGGSQSVVNRSHSIHKVAQQPCGHSSNLLTSLVLVLVLSIAVLVLVFAEHSIRDQ